MNRPDDGADIEVAEDKVVAAADIQVEAVGGGLVHMTIDAEGTDVSLCIVLTGAKAEQLGDLLFKQGSRALA